MPANVTTAVSPRRALVVPDDAVLETGTRKLVFVASSDGRLTPREVKPETARSVSGDHRRAQ